MHIQIVSCQIPKSPNSYNQNGKKEGKWTILFDENWNQLDNESNAHYYRIIEYHDGKPDGLVRDFYLSGNLQWEGNLRSENPDCIEGKSLLFYENGNIREMANYEDCNPSELALYWSSDGYFCNVLKEIDGIYKKISINSLNTREARYCEELLISAVNHFKPYSSNLHHIKNYILNSINLLQFYFIYFEPFEKFIYDYEGETEDNDTIILANNFRVLLEEMKGYKLENLQSAGVNDINEYTLIGNKLFDFLFFENSIKAYSKAIELIKKTSNPLDYKLDSYYFRLAQSYYKNKVYDSLGVLFDKIIDIELNRLPDLQRTYYYNIHQHLWSIKEFGGIESVILKYLNGLFDINKESPKGLYEFKYNLTKDLIKLYFQLGDIKSCEYYLKILENYHPGRYDKDIDLTRIRGHIYLINRQPYQALEYFKKILSLSYETAETGEYKYSAGIPLIRIDDTLTISRILGNSPGSMAGLKSMDQIIEIDGRNVVNEVDSVIRRLMAIDNLEIKVRRSGECDLLCFTIPKDSIPDYDFSLLNRNIYDQRIDMADYYFLKGLMDSCLYMLKENQMDINWGGSIKDGGYFELAFLIGKVYESIELKDLSDLYFLSAIEASILDFFYILNEINREGGVLRQNSGVSESNIYNNFLIEKLSNELDSLFIQQESTNSLSSDNFLEATKADTTKKKFRLSLMLAPKEGFALDISQYLFQVLYMAEYFKERSMQIDTIHNDAVSNDGLLLYSNNSLSTKYCDSFDFEWIKEDDTLQPHNINLDAQIYDTLSYNLLVGAMDMAINDYLKLQRHLTTKNRELLFDKFFYNSQNQFYYYFHNYLEKNPTSKYDLINYRLVLKSLVLRSNQYIERFIQQSSLKDEFLSSLYHELDSLRQVVKQLESNESSEKINVLVREANGVEKEILDYIDFHELDMSFISSWEDVRNVLSDDEAAVEIIRAENIMSPLNDISYFFILITNDSEPQILLFSNGVELENKYYEKYQRDLYKEISGDSVLYHEYWSRIEKILSEKNTIYISPDGVYNKLNLLTLEIPGNKYYIQTKNIIYLNSLLDLVSKKEICSSSKNKAWLFGNPDFSATEQVDEINSTRETNPFAIRLGSNIGFENIVLSELPNTKIEIDLINTMLCLKNWNTEVFLGKDATEENFKKSMNPDLLHVATHGFFIEDFALQSASSGHYYGIKGDNLVMNPMLRSGLLLSGCESIINNNLIYNKEDGVLTANEIMDMDFSNTNLVVLSSCSSGKGKIKPGEGVFGLQRAFYLAGAKSTLISLWPVEDRSTRLLMESFYNHWLEGDQYGKALREAQLKLMQDTLYSRPIFWGPFIQIGQ